MRKINKEFWQGKRVLLTGHTGFKGSWLSLWLQSMGVILRGIALEPPSNPALFEIANISAGMDHKILDIRNFIEVQSEIQNFRPEIIIHMAAQPLVRLSFQQPVLTYSTNVMGTVNILEASRSVDTVRCIINVTTDKCYENREWVWGYRESEQLGGNDPYSNSKGCSELITSAYRHSFYNPSKYSEHKVAIASARAGNVIGGGDWANDRLIPDILDAIGKGQKVNIRNPNATRPWQHVLEPLSGYLLLAESLYTSGTEFGEAFNFGPNYEDTKPVHWIVDQLCRYWGTDNLSYLDMEIHPHESQQLSLDCAKAKSKLGWHPHWNIDKSLQRIVDWQKEYLSNGNMRNFCMHQINEFMN